MRVVYNIPLPPSTNNLFYNFKGGRAKTQEYRDWITAAGWDIARQRREQRAANFKQMQVALCYEIEEKRRDLGNIEKPCSDLLVSMGVIEDDGPKYVREITSRWAKVRGVRVTVTAIGVVA